VNEAEIHRLSHEILTLLEEEEALTAQYRQRQQDLVQARNALAMRRKVLMDLGAERAKAKRSEDEKKGQ
jgi:hypothetical protein